VSSPGGYTLHRKRFPPETGSREVKEWKG
jgi:hypothetical protein